MAHIQPDNIISVSDTQDLAYLEYLESKHRGIKLVPEPYGNTPTGLKADGGDFAKWIKQNHSNLPVSLPTLAPKISLHGADVWLPLIYLAGDVSMQIFLNIVASYLYEKHKGNLPSERQKIHLSILYQNKRNGVTRKFDFSGDSDALTKAVKRFDLDNFFDESAK